MRTKQTRTIKSFRWTTTNAISTARQSLIHMTGHPTLMPALGKQVQCLNHNRVFTKHASHVIDGSPQQPSQRQHKNGRKGPEPSRKAARHRHSNNSHCDKLTKSESITWRANQKLKSPERIKSRLFMRAQRKTSAHRECEMVDWTLRRSLCITDGTNTHRKTLKEECEPKYVLGN